MSDPRTQQLVSRSRLQLVKQLAHIERQLPTDHSVTVHTGLVMDKAIIEGILSVRPAIHFSIVRNGVCSSKVGEPFFVISKLDSCWLLEEGLAEDKMGSCGTFTKLADAKAAAEPMLHERHEAQARAASDAFWAHEGEAFDFKPGEVIAHVLDDSGTGGEVRLGFDTGTMVEVAIDARTLTGRKVRTINLGKVVGRSELKNGVTNQQVQLTEDMTVWAPVSTMSDAGVDADLFALDGHLGWVPRGCEGCGDRRDIGCLKAHCSWPFFPKPSGPPPVDPSPVQGKFEECFTCTFVGGDTGCTKPTLHHRCPTPLHPSESCATVDTNRLDAGLGLASTATEEDKMNTAFNIVDVSDSGVLAVLIVPGDEWSLQKLTIEVLVNSVFTIRCPFTRIEVSMTPQAPGVWAHESGWVQVAGVNSFGIDNPSVIVTEGLDGTGHVIARKNHDEPVKVTNDQLSGQDDVHDPSRVHGSHFVVEEPIDEPEPDAVTLTAKPRTPFAPWTDELHEFQCSTLQFGSVRTVASPTPSSARDIDTHCWGTLNMDLHGIVQHDAPMVSDAGTTRVDEWGTDGFGGLSMVGRAISANVGWALHDSVDSTWADGAVRGWSPVIVGWLPTDGQGLTREELDKQLNDSTWDTPNMDHLIFIANALHNLGRPEFAQRQQAQVWDPDGSITMISQTTRRGDNVVAHVWVPEHEWTDRSLQRASDWERHHVPAQLATVELAYSTLNGSTRPYLRCEMQTTSLERYSESQLLSSISAHHKTTGTPSTRVMTESVMSRMSMRKDITDDEVMAKSERELAYFASVIRNWHFAVEVLPEPKPEPKDTNRLEEWEVVDGHGRVLYGPDTHTRCQQHSFDYPLSPAPIRVRPVEPTPPEEDTSMTPEDITKQLADSKPWIVSDGGKDAATYMVITETPEQARVAVSNRRGTDAGAWGVELGWALNAAITLCPLCNEGMMVAHEENLPYTAWAHCKNPACPGVKRSYKGLGFTICIPDPHSLDYYGDDTLVLTAADGWCQTCGEHAMVMNTSMSSPNCVNPECLSYLAPGEAGIDEDDFIMSCVDPEEWNISFCDNCSTACGEGEDEHPEVDGEVVTLCSDCLEEKAGCDYCSGYSTNPALARWRDTGTSLTICGGCMDRLCPEQVKVDGLQDMFGITCPKCGDLLTQTRANPTDKEDQPEVSCPTCTGTYPKPPVKPTEAEESAAQDEMDSYPYEDEDEALRAQSVDQLFALAFLPLEHKPVKDAETGVPCSVQSARVELRRRVNHGYSMHMKVNDLLSELHDANSLKRSYRLKLENLRAELAPVITWLTGDEGGDEHPLHGGALLWDDDRTVRDHLSAL